jgi:hypothetical protein
VSWSNRLETRPATKLIALPLAIVTPATSMVEPCTECQRPPAKGKAKTAGTESAKAAALSEPLIAKSASSTT